MGMASLTLRRYGASPGSHAHDHYQVLVGLDGVLDLEIEGRGQRIAAGDACVVQPGDRHDFASTLGSHCLVLDTAEAGWADCALKPADPAQTQALAHYLAAALRKNHALAAHHGPSLLLEAWRASPAAAPTRARRHIDWPALTTWARERWHTPLSVADLASQACLSASQFAQRCRQEQGSGAMEWLRAQRLHHARALRAAGLPVAETARRTGYRSPSALTAALRRQRSG